MNSAVIADYIQFVVLSISLLVIAFVAIFKLGFNNIFDTIQSVMGTAGFDPTVAENGCGWEYILWIFFLGLVSCAIWPTAVARALSMESPKIVKKQYMFTSVSYLICFLIPFLL